MSKVAMHEDDGIVARQNGAWYPGQPAHLDFGLNPRRWRAFLTRSSGSAFAERMPGIMIDRFAESTMSVMSYTPKP